MLSFAYLDKKLYAEGITEMEKCCGNPKTTLGTEGMAYAYAIAGRKTDAVRLLHQLLEPSPRPDVDHTLIARVYTALGDNDRAFEWLEKGYAEHEFQPDLLVINAEFASVRADPRYAAVVRKLKLAH
jgi:hypothetical protein